MLFRSLSFPSFSTFLLASVLTVLENTFHVISSNLFIADLLILVQLQSSYPPCASDSVVLLYASVTRLLLHPPIYWLWLVTELHVCVVEFAFSSFLLVSFVVES